jgi:predicted alpha/beta superfamily hydrolase
VSGSLWFDGFVDYLSGHPLLGAPERVYLSLGDREEQAKNPRMQRVRAATEATKAVIEAQGVPCAFELNPGGHFQDVPARQRRAVLALL